MRLRIDLNGNSDAKGTHMSIFLQLMKGEFDDIIEWPFDKMVTFVVIHQDKNKCFKHSLRAKNQRVNSFKQPVNNHNEPFGFRSFIALEKLHADGFIKNDTIYIRCVIE